MSENAELAEIEASVKAIVRRAYELGRSDALKTVVNALSSATRSCGTEPLALMAPAPAATVTHGAPAQPAPAATPWWARR